MKAKEGNYTVRDVLNIRVLTVVYSVEGAVYSVYS